MDNFNINNLVFQRAVAKNIISEADTILQKISKNLSKLSEEYFELEKQLKTIGEINSVFEHAKKLESVNNEIITNLAVKDRLQFLSEKNKERVVYLNFEIKTKLIEEFEVNQKQLVKTITETKFNVTDSNLNINSELTGNWQIFFNDSLLQVKNGNLDLNVPSNMETLSHFEEKYLSMVFDKYPTCLSNIPVELLLNTKFKLKILKYIANSTDRMLRTKSIFEINEHFGGILNIKIGQDINFKKYVLEINNLFNVKIRKYLMGKYPLYTALIHEKINCKPNSVFLPDSVKSSNDIDILATLFDNLAN